MQHFLLIVVLIWASRAIAYPVDTSKYKSIQVLAAQGEVEASLKGLGGYSGKHFRASVENKTTDSVFVWVEAGRRIFSDDSTIQDIFIAHHELLALAPLTKDSIDLTGYCCQASNRAPYASSTFTSGEMAPKIWVQLAEFLHVNEFPTQAVQSAVWVLSDQKPLGSIHHDNQELINPLKRKVAELLGITVPWYSVHLKKVEGQLSSDVVEQIQGEIAFYLPSNGVVSILIKDQYGMNVTYPIKGEAYGPGEYTYNLKQNVEGWQQGQYTIWVLHDYQYPLKKLSFKI